jgi:hypothetical protein
MQGRQFFRVKQADFMARHREFLESHGSPEDPMLETIVDSTPMVYQIIADESVLQSLDDDPAWHAMSLISAGSTLCADCVTGLAKHGVTTGDNMFVAARRLGNHNPLLRPARF